MMSWARGSGANHLLGQAAASAPADLPPKPNPGLQLSTAAAAVPLKQADPRLRAPKVVPKAGRKAVHRRPVAPRRLHVPRRQPVQRHAPAVPLATAGPRRPAVPSLLLGRPLLRDALEQQPAVLPRRAVPAPAHVLPPVHRPLHGLRRHKDAPITAPVAPALPVRVAAPVVPSETATLLDVPMPPATRAPAPSTGP